MAVALLFSGQGAQRVGMGQSFYENSPTARAIYDRAEEVLGWDLKRISFEGPQSALTETHICQPALYVFGYAISQTLRETGLFSEVGAVLGLSLGELTALAVAEAFAFEEGLKLVAERGRLMQEACETTDGAMASVIGASQADVEDLCREFDIDIANINCPGQIVISGERAKVMEAILAGERREIRTILPLDVAGAYHSRLMAGAGRQFGETLSRFSVYRPMIPFFTNTTGGNISDPDDIRASLAKQIVSPVNWERCMRSTAQIGIGEFYECGPKGVLAGLARRIERSWQVTKLNDYSDLPKSYSVR